jgi:diadenylate cyclase
MVSWIWEALEWSDVFDIAIMAFVLYRTLLALQGTRAIQSLVGLFVVMGLYIVAEQLKLTSVTWLFDRLFVYIVLAIIILFQDDFFPRVRRSVDISAFEEVIRATFTLAGRRIGALIVFERGASLDEYGENATAIEGRISQELLLAIFHPTSPLHDGAVLIQKGQLAAAKVILPLTQSTKVSRFFGTRHRAAIGLTEATDAVVIVVSEERGTVSVAASGEIRPTHDANELRSALQTLLNDEAAAPRPAPAGA